MNYCLAAEGRKLSSVAPFPPRDKSTSHFSHLGLSKLLSVGLFTPHTHTHTHTHTLFTHFLPAGCLLQQSDSPIPQPQIFFCSFLIISAGLRCYFWKRKKKQHTHTHEWTKGVCIYQRLSDGRERGSVSRCRTRGEAHNSISSVK